LPPTTGTYASAPEASRTLRRTKTALPAVRRAPSFRCSGFLRNVSVCVRNARDPGPRGRRILGVRFGCAGPPSRRGQASFEESDQLTGLLTTPFGRTTCETPIDPTHTGTRDREQQARAAPHRRRRALLVAERGGHRGQAEGGATQIGRAHV